MHMRVGESYAGLYIPMLSYNIINFNAGRPAVPINLKGELEGRMKMGRHAFSVLPPRVFVLMGCVRSWFLDYYRCFYLHNLPSCLALRLLLCAGIIVGNGCIGNAAGVCGSSLYGEKLSLEQYHGHG